MLIFNSTMILKIDLSHKYFYFRKVEYFKIDFSNLFVNINNQKVVFICFNIFNPKKFLFQDFNHSSFII